MMARSITVSRIHKRWCNSHDNPDIRRQHSKVEQNKSWIGILICGIQLLDPILDMDEVLEFVSPSHSRIEWLDRPQE